MKSLKEVILKYNLKKSIYYIAYLALLLFIVNNISFTYYNIQLNKISENLELEKSERERKKRADNQKNIEVKNKIYFSRQIQNTKNFSENTISEFYKNLNQAVLDKNISTFDCHEISHALGAKVSINTPLEKSLGYNIYNLIKNQNCATGFYHELTINLARKNKNNQNDKYFESVLNKILNKYEKYVYDMPSSDNLKYLDLLHGLGHSIFEKEGSIEKAVLACEKLSQNSSIRDLCVSGIYMQTLGEKIELGLPIPIEFCKNKKYSYACLTGYPHNNIDLSDADKFVNFCKSLTNKDDIYGCSVNFMRYILLGEKNTLLSKKNFCNAINNNLVEKNPKLKYICENILMSKNNFPLEICNNINPLSFYKCVQKSKEQLQILYIKP